MFVIQKDKNKIKKPKKGFTPQKFAKIIIIIFIIAGIFIFGFTYYFANMLKSAGIVPPIQLPKYVSFNASLKSQDILFNNKALYIVPYALFNYSASNITSVNITARLLDSKPPNHIYILNWSGECVDCGYNNNFVENLSFQLFAMHIINSTNPIHIISESNLGSLNSSDYLFIINGRMPQYLFNNTPSGVSLIQQILDNGVTVIYIGGNFSRTLTSQSVVVPAVNIPSFLATNTSSLINKIIYNNITYNQNLSFKLSSGKLLNDMSYEPVGNGYIFLFPNYLSSFPNMNIAANFFGSFMFNDSWIPSISSGARSVLINYSSKEQGNIGLLFNFTTLFFNKPTMTMLNSSYIDVIMDAHSIGGLIYIHHYLFKPYFSVNGTLDMPSDTSPGVPVPTQATIFINHSTFVEPHIDIYSLNMTYISSAPPIFAKNLSSTFSFFENFTPTVSKGFYIVQLNGYSGQHYASGLISVPPLDISLIIGNYTQGRFLFVAFAGGKPVSNVTARVMLNNNYSENVIIRNGSFIYTLPSGTSVQQGYEIFTVYALSQVAMFSSYYKPAFVAINQQYIEFIIALIIVILEITLVKTPFKDEFYIDVSNLPEPVKTPIKIRENELLNVFNALNNYYHWRYMPLSKMEFKNAIATNIRINSIPVNLTYENVELILNSLVTKGDVVTIDELYAPSSWIEQSKHDIEYLAAFKKMRTYLISHGHIFTDLDKSDVTDIITTLHNEKAYLIIYSKTSKFISKLPVQENIKTYLVFLNDDKLEEFKRNLYSSISNEFEMLRMYIATKNIILISADNPEGILS